MSLYLHSIKLEDTPDLSGYGLTHAPIRGSFYVRKGDRKPYGDFSASKIAATAQIALSNNQPLILDIEDLDLPAEVDQLAGVLETVRQTCPGLRVALYGILPPYKAHGQNMRWYITRDADQLRAWGAASRELFDRLAPLVDFTMPSLYTLDRPWFTHGIWEVYAQLNIEVSHRYHLPCIPALWTEFHLGGADDMRPGMVPADRWRGQLDYLGGNADGFCIWIAKRGLQPVWNDSAPWWLETQQFLKEAG